MHSIAPSDGFSTWWSVILTFVFSNRNSFSNSFTLNATQRRRRKFRTSRHRLHENNKIKSGKQTNATTLYNRLANWRRGFRWRKTVGYFHASTVVGHVLFRNRISPRRRAALWYSLSNSLSPMFWIGLFYRRLFFCYYFVFGKSFSLPFIYWKGKQWWLTMYIQTDIILQIFRPHCSLPKSKSLFHVKKEEETIKKIWPSNRSTVLKSEKQFRREILDNIKL